ncbi:thioredoxin-like protein [Dyadobacter jejuensis]|uniref:Thioredoxin-like protein n=1 Tax=Dyadobacter jejuensis TaxID=1082580 RepID=A0A316ANA8_9BACT|nr:thioredoxin fold domain-containing protein [Dyadobacter jejuensis]PWJ59245.1 thioredoxin-like protein [Dyadobacter jejuensis]
MKKVWSYLLWGGVIAGVYYYNNPQVDFQQNSEEGIQFQNDKWVNALAKAKQENKLVFLDVYATWCGPCKKLKKYTFSDSDVGNYFNKHFVNVALNAEVNEGAVAANFYGVNSYPTVLFVDGDGNVVKRHSGYLNAGELLKLGEELQMD